MEFNLEDIIGSKFNCLVVKEYSHFIRNKHGIIHYYTCQCDCGTVTKVSRDRLIHLRAKSCGCLRGKRKVKTFNPENIIGKRFGKLLVLEYLGNESGYNYVCQCDCGNKVNVYRQNLLYKHTKSCGCLKNIKGKSNKSWKGFEGLSGRYWKSIVNKANRKSRILEFSITIEYSWNLFLSQDKKCALTGLPIDMPKSKGNYRHTASLDRINNDLGYTEGNVQWVHKNINWMKGTMAQDEFIAFCKLVVNNSEKQK